MNVLKNIGKKTEGATAIEYAVIAGLIGLAIVSSAESLSSSVDLVVQRLQGGLDPSSGATARDGDDAYSE